VATGTVYKHYSGKAELVTAVFREVVGHEVAAVAEAGGSGGVVERVTASVETFAGRALKNPKLAYVLLAEPVDTAVDAERLRFRRAFAEIYETAVAEGVAGGQLPPQNPRVSAAALVGAIGEVLVGPLAEARRGPADMTETTPIFAEIASAWFASDRPVPVDWELGERPGDDPVPASVTAASLVPSRAGLLDGPDLPVPVSTTNPLGQAFATAADEGWRAASGAAAERPDELTAAGLPKRRPRARLVPGSAGSAVLAAPASPTRSAESVRGRLASYQQGVRQGREIRLRRDFADKRLFPAIDAVQSGTRREELLMSKEELQIVWKLRRVLSGLDGQQALELLLERLKKSQTNVEFLMQVQKTTPGALSDD